MRGFAPLRLWSVAVAIWAAGQGAWAACSEERVEIRGDFGAAAFAVELADTLEERAQGLMHRPELARSAGMLFLYERPQHAQFWMKNTLIPLDMIFAGPDGVVRHVHENAVPGDLTPIDGGEGIIAVLEINGGMARALGIAPGAEMRHPGFAPEIAAWSCAGTD